MAERRTGRDATANDGVVRGWLGQGGQVPPFLELLVLGRDGGNLPPLLPSKVFRPGSARPFPMKKRRKENNMKRKYIAALLAALTVVSCSPLDRNGGRGISAPRAIPVYDSSPMEAIINGLRNVQQISRESRTTTGEMRGLGDAFSR